MSIFGIIAICLLIWGIFFLVAVALPYALDCFEDYLYLKIATTITIMLFIGSIFIGIGLNTESEKVFVQKYLAQKETIEMSLEVEELSGLERLELVKQATELNGELAERKATFELWHFVVYDNTIYDNVELISLKKGE